MTKRMWRALVRIVETNPLKDELIVVLPGWDSTQQIKLKLSEVPVSISEREPLFRCHAVNVGEQGKHVIIPETLTPLEIKAIGRGSRQMCLMNKYGFPRTKPKAFKRVKGFQTGDIARAVVPKGKRAKRAGGTHVGPVAVRSRGSFRVGGVDDINWKYCQLIQRVDGYSYCQAMSNSLLPEKLYG